MITSEADHPHPSLRGCAHPPHRQQPLAAHRTPRRTAAVPRRPHRAWPAASSDRPAQPRSAAPQLPPKAGYHSLGRPSHRPPLPAPQPPSPLLPPLPLPLTPPPSVPLPCPSLRTRAAAGPSVSHRSTADAADDAPPHDAPHPQPHSPPPPAPPPASTPTPSPAPPPHAQCAHAASPPSPPHPPPPPPLSTASTTAPGQ